MMTLVGRPNLHQVIGWLALGLLGLVAGCATSSKTGSQTFTVFPPPPDEPRIQYLTSYNSEDDLGGQSRFSEFVVGKERVFRPLWKPYGITAWDGKIYICDTQPANVTVIDLAKRRFRYLKPEGQGAMKLPVNAAVDKDGTLYVTDTGRNQVLIYGRDGNLVGEMGQRGEMRPCGITLAGDRLYVTDLSNHCVRVYQKATRELLFTVPRKPDEKNKLFSPTNIAVDQQGRMYVSDTGGFFVQIYDAEGNHLRTVGELGIEIGRFALPKGVGVDREGRMYVVDAATAVVQMFDAEGRMLMYFGEPKSSGPGALYLPAGLTIDYDNVGYFQKYVAPGKKLEYLILVTNQAGLQKVSVYGFLQKK